MTWAKVLAEARALAARAARPFELGVESQVEALATAGEGRWRPPDEVGPGYWPTMCLHWRETESHPIEVEVFPDRLELYVFGPRHDFSVDSHDAPSAGPIPIAFASALDHFVPERPA